MSDLQNAREKLHLATQKANAEIATRLPLDNQDDFEAARKGLIAQLPAGGVAAPNGRKAWDIADFDFLNGECPPSVNPSLWRMGQLNNISGLFEVTDGVWQARGCDYANLTIIRGETGWILVDPLMTRQTSAAVLDLVNTTLGERPVSAILVTHTHPDHFGGLKGVTGDDPNHYPPIYAPAEFVTYSASEGILGGNQMSRRAIYQFGLTLPTSEHGVVDGGIGKSPAKGQRTFVKPNYFIEATGERRTIDGVNFVFQMASGTEAPAEFTFMLPDHKVLCMAEVCTQTMHNALPPRGAQVRDTLLWSRTIDEAITLFGGDSEILINCHNWPVWGNDKLRTYMEEQRDIYKYTHDQALRLANHGHTPSEIADQINEPEWLSEKFHARGYYGTLKFNARAVYQMYYGFYDGNPVNLSPLPPEQLGEHIVDAIGGFENVLAKAEEAIEKDALQWAATLLSHAAFASAQDDSKNEKAANTAKQLLAEVYRHMGYREESGIMRNVYLSGAKELEDGVKPLPMLGGRNEDLAATLSPQDWFDAYAIRLNPDRARGVNIVLNFNIDDCAVCVGVVRQTEFARIDYLADDADATISIAQDQLEAIVSGNLTLEDAGAEIKGNRAAVQQWLDLHDNFNLWFNIVTP